MDVISRCRAFLTLTLTEEKSTILPIILHFTLSNDPITSSRGMHGMKVEICHRELIRAILRADYSERDLRDFVSLCYSLAYPHVRSKMARGKWTALAMGLDIEDVAGDCIADLFERDIA